MQNNDLKAIVESTICSAEQKRFADEHATSDMVANNGDDYR